jgi:hypothetical protein
MQLLCIYLSFCISFPRGVFYTCLSLEIPYRGCSWSAEYISESYHNVGA